MRRNFLYKKGHVERARELRKVMTPAERKLWYEFLRYQKPRFYRQRPIGRFIADFYCAAAKLVIEVDGESHATQEARAYDQERTALLQGLGVSVLRFTNLEVMRDFEEVCRSVMDAVRSRTPLP